MTEEIKAKPKSRTSWYINTGSNNLFTEVGRCPPQGKVFLSPQIAKNYKELKLTKA